MKYVLVDSNQREVVRTDSIEEIEFYIKSYSLDPLSHIILRYGDNGIDNLGRGQDTHALGRGLAKSPT